jgi:hypothetical protein
VPPSEAEAEPPTNPNACTAGGRNGPPPDGGERGERLRQVGPAEAEAEPA